MPRSRICFCLKKCHYGGMLWSGFLPISRWQRNCGIVKLDSEKKVWPYVPVNDSLEQRNAMRRNKTTEKAAIRKMEQNIRSRANYSFAVLGMGFVRNGSGRSEERRVGKE